MRKIPDRYYQILESPGNQSKKFRQEIIQNFMFVSKAVKKYDENNFWKIYLRLIWKTYQISNTCMCIKQLHII